MGKIELLKIFLPSNPFDWIMVGSVLILCGVIFYYHRQNKKLVKRLNLDPKIPGVVSYEHFSYVVKRELIRINNAWKKGERRVSKLYSSLVVVDMDDFHNFNIKYGYPAGDEALRKTAEILLNLFRPTEVVVARNSAASDEFLIYASGLRAKEAEKRLKEIEEEIKRRTLNDKTKKKIHFSVTGGFSEFPSSGKNLEDLIERAGRMANTRKKQKGIGLRKE